jgi:hypothetical protein
MLAVLRHVRTGGVLVNLPNVESLKARVNKQEGAIYLMPRT